MSVNKVIILGNLGKDPELKYTQGGSAVTTFSVATSEKYKDRNGEQREKTEWHTVVAWGKTAELCAEYLKKGSKAFVEGKLQTRSWEDKSGAKRYSTEVVALTVQFLSPLNVKDKPVAVENVERVTGGKSTEFDYGPPPMADDDIPF